LLEVLVREEFQNSSKPIVETDFAELQDGSLVDLIQDPLDPSKSMLAFYHKGVVQQVEEVRNGGRILIPTSRKEASHKHVRLPRGTEPFVSVNQLFLECCSVLNSCIDLSPNWLGPMAIFGMSTWFPEKTAIAPYLALVGPPGSGKTTAMRALSLVCRRSFLTADLTSAGFYDVCDRMRPTLFIDETLSAGHPPTILHLLRSGNSPGFVSLRKNKAQFAYGPKVLAWLELPKDGALNSRCLIIPMQRTTRTDLKSPNDPDVVRYAEKIQMQMLQFRFEYFNKLTPPKMPVEAKLSGRSLDLYRALALPVGEDEGLCTLLARWVAGQRQFHRCLLSAPQISMLRVLIGLVHQQPNDFGYWLSDLTHLMNMDLSDHGEPAGLNERRAGEILTSLGLTNRTRRNAGYFLWLDRAGRARIHQHVREYEVDYAPPAYSSNCGFCAEAGTAASASDTPGVPVVKQHDSDRPKRGHGVRRWRRPPERVRSPIGSPKRSRPT
jgi:hypothetical protein